MTIARIKSSYHHAFTLIELLVVISVIALLIPLLLPAMQGTCFAAKISQCESITRQLQLGRWMYGDDNDGKLIRHRGLPSDSWDGNNVVFMRTSPEKSLSSRTTTTLRRYFPVPMTGRIRPALATSTAVTPSWTTSTPKWSVTMVSTIQWKIAG